MAYLVPTPAHLLVDSSDRPYFLWDVDLTLPEFRERLNASDTVVRAYFMAKLMRQAKPDDVFSFVTLADIRGAWSLVAPHLGNTRHFWTWLLEATKRPDADER